MKNTNQSVLSLLTLLSLCFTGFAADPTAAKKSGFVDFGTFSPSTSGREFVEVNLGNNLISMAARLAEKQEPQIAEALRGLEQIRVNVIGLDDDNRATVEQRIKTIRTQLDDQGWERIVTAQQKNEDIAIFIKTHGQDAVAGIVVTVLEGNKEAVLVNIVGNIKPEKLAIIGERFNLDPLKKLGRRAHDSRRSDESHASRR